MRAFRIQFDYSVINHDTGDGEGDNDIVCVIAETSEHAREYILVGDFREKLTKTGGEISIEIQHIEDVGEAFLVEE